MNHIREAKCSIEEALMDFFIKKGQFFTMWISGEERLPIGNFQDDSIEAYTFSQCGSYWIPKPNLPPIKLQMDEFEQWYFEQSFGGDPAFKEVARRAFYRKETPLK